MIDCIYAIKDFPTSLYIQFITGFNFKKIDNIIEAVDDAVKENYNNIIVLHDDSEFLFYLMRLVTLESCKFKNNFYLHKKDFHNIVTNNITVDALDRYVLYNDLYTYNNAPLVTVIICAYNAVDTIEMSITSILNQNYKFIELIVVDDCSTDDTWNKIKTAAESDPRIINIKNKENKGCYASRNIALELARGSFITFHDADDFSLSDRIVTQLNTLLEKNVMFTSCLIVRSHLKNFNILNGVKDENMSHVLMQNVVKLQTHRTYCCKAILGMVTHLFKREIFDFVGNFMELRCIADAEFCERILYKYAGIKFTGDQSVVTYLSQNNVPELYHRVEQVLYISKEMDANNITSIFKSKREYLNGLIDNWRKNYY
jgi:glycosyltransferase involved in cell wall biosynthesis